MKVTENNDKIIITNIDGREMIFELDGDETEYYELESTTTPVADEYWYDSMTKDEVIEFARKFFS